MYMYQLSIAHVLKHVCSCHLVSYHERQLTLSCLLAMSGLQLPCPLQVGTPGWQVIISCIPQDSKAHSFRECDMIFSTGSQYWSTLSRCSKVTVKIKVQFRTVSLQVGASSIAASDTSNCGEHLGGWRFHETCTCGYDTCDPVFKPTPEHSHHHRLN